MRRVIIWIVRIIDNFGCYKQSTNNLGGLGTVFPRFGWDFQMRSSSAAHVRFWDLGQSSRLWKFIHHSNKLSSAPRCTLSYFLWQLAGPAVEWEISIDYNNLFSEQLLFAKPFTKSDINIVGQIKTTRLSCPYYGDSRPESYCRWSHGVDFTLFGFGLA